MREMSRPSLAEVSAPRCVSSFVFALVRHKFATTCCDGLKKSREEMTGAYQRLNSGDNSVVLPPTSWFRLHRRILHAQRPHGAVVLLSHAHAFVHGNISLAFGFSKFLLSPSMQL